jgi:hypothetical protein
MFLRAGEFINQEVINVWLATHAGLLESICEHTISKRVNGEDGAVATNTLPTIHCISPFLIPHSELGWHLAVRYQYDATSRNKSWVSRMHTLHQGQLLHRAARLFLR